MRIVAMLAKVIFVGVLAIVAFKVYQFAEKMGYHVTIYDHHPGPCRALPIIEHGSEDMVLLPNDKVLISSGVRYLHRTSPNYAQSVASMYMFDLNQPNTDPRKVALEGFEKDIKDCDFHGIAIWTDKESGKNTIYIVNHLEHESVVEIFEYDDKRNVLIYEETVGSGDPDHHFTNDLEVVGPRQFYITNHYYSTKTAKWEFQLHLKWGSVTYYDGSKSMVATKQGRFMPNGIAQSLNGSLIYVAVGGGIITYKRNSDNTLTFLEETPIPGFPDNFYVDPESGDLWVGCHPVGHRVFEYLDNPEKRSPSQVLHIKSSYGYLSKIFEVFVDSGSLIPASTIAIYHKNKLLIGGVASNAAICDVKYL